MLLLDDNLDVKKEHKNLGFVALITDSHSRRTKYIQALALNIPCLHHRWLMDSISASVPLPFGKYLLPAGISTYLNPSGIARSRTMDLYDPGSEDVSFKETLKGRELLLQDESVLIVTGTTKKELERKAPYLFLTSALGPNEVGRCADLNAAKSMFKDGGWDWIYVDGGVDGVAEAANALLDKVKSTGKKTGPKSKKRKRDQSEDGEESKAMALTGTIGGKKVRLACDEFVVQSLILGALIEE